MRRSGLTFAPEAGTQRMRDVINKNVTEEEVLRTCTKAFAGGWTSVKLYFMMGLPTETMEDIAGIAQLAGKVVDAYYNTPEHKKGCAVSVSVSCASFIPSPLRPSSGAGGHHDLLKGQAGPLVGECAPAAKSACPTMKRPPLF